MPRKLSVENSLSTGWVEFKSVRFDQPHQPDYFLPKHYMAILVAYFAIQLAVRAACLFMFVVFWIWVLGA